MFRSQHRFCLLAWVIGCGVTLASPAIADQPSGPDAPTSSYLPSVVTEQDFDILMSRSPFLRPLDLSKTLSLTGIADIAGEPVVTLYDRDTKSTHVVTRDVNARGWQMVAVDGDRAQPETVAARISVAGEQFSIKFDPGQLKPEPTPALSPDARRQVASDAANFREGISGDGHPGPPPPEMVAKLARLSQGQREQIIATVAEMRQRGAGSEERRQAFARMVDRALINQPR